MVKFPRSERAGFYPVSGFFGFVILSTSDFGLRNQIVKELVELLFKEGVKVGPRRTKMWIYGEITAERVEDLLYEVYPREWLDVQIV